MRSDFSLKWLLSPFSIGQFQRSYWNKSPLRITRQDQHYYSDLLSERDLDWIVHIGNRQRGALELLNGGGRPIRPRGTQSIMSSILEGMSLRINGIQRFHPHLNNLRTQIEARLSCGVNINMYLTPDEGKALGQHYDTHDVFVVQVSGNKRWKLFDSPVLNPLEAAPIVRGEARQDFKLRLARTKPTESTALVDDFILSPGDLLYLPRGFWHQAQGTAGTISCHLTIGLQPYTYLDAITITLTEAAHEISDLRRPLPPGFAWSDATQEVEDTLNNIQLSIQRALIPSKVLSSIKQVFAHTRHPVKELRLLTPAPTTDPVSTTKYTRYTKTYPFMTLEQVGEDIMVSANGTQAAIRATAAKALQVVAKRKVFAATDLPEAISLTERIHIITELSNAGLIRPTQNATNRQGVGAGWLPTNISASNRVTWVHFGGMKLEEPFFQQSVRRRLKLAPMPAQKLTPIASLRNLNHSTAPSGMIFHISRCGSTLLSNSLRLFPDANVISEPAIINQLLLRPIDPESSVLPLDQILRNALSALSIHRLGSKQRTVFKFTSWNLFSLARLRALWPDVPAVFVIRNPLEVLISLTTKLPGWLQPSFSDSTSLPLESIRGKDPAVAASNVLGAFLQIIDKNALDFDRIIDYTQISERSVREIAHTFGFDSECPLADNITDTLKIYSKDPTRSKLFTGDSECKRAEATPSIREQIEASTGLLYERLLKRSMESLSVDDSTG